ncbi:hypothetical protein CR513_17670, partial [Mucuna pruriens]
MIFGLRVVDITSLEKEEWKWLITNLWRCYDMLLRLVDDILFSLQNMKAQTIYANDIQQLYESIHSLATL